MRLVTIDTSFLASNGQVRAGVSRPEVAVLLGEHLFVLVCAEFQAEIQTRIKALNDASANNAPWVRAAVERQVGYCFGGPQEKRGSASLGQIRNFCKFLGQGCRDDFELLLAADNQAMVSYESLFNNRNNIAHGGQRAVTLRDALTYYWSGHRVVDYLLQAVGPYLA